MTPMATKTEEAIQGVVRDVSILKEKVEILRDEVLPIRSTTERLAVVEHQLREITKTKELWGQRGWMVLTICLSAVFSFIAVVLGALLTFYLNSKR
jgi:hypothetical protein